MGERDIGIYCVLRTMGNGQAFSTPLFSDVGMMLDGRLFVIGRKGQRVQLRVNQEEETKRAFYIVFLGERIEEELLKRLGREKRKRIG